MTVQETEGEKKSINLLNLIHFTVRKNIQQALATKIQETAFSVRKQQKALLDRLENLNSATPLPEYIAVDPENLNDEDRREMAMMEDVAQGR